METGRLLRSGGLRTLIVLGRVSNLPTVWSNCLAGWWLAGTGAPGRFLLVTLGASFLYLGGMFLNDAFDAQFDHQHRPERPIPSGAIRAAVVWQWGFSWLALGLLCLGLLGFTTALCGWLLAVCLLIYNAVHKIFAFSPLFIAACRFLLVLTAATTARAGITGLTIWSALVLACYIVGLSALARKETTQGSLRYWPLLALFAPILLALIVNRGPYWERGLLWSVVLTAWIFRCVRTVYWARQQNVAHGVAGLLAGIVLVDLLAICGGPPLVGFTLVCLFLLALVLQRFAPAT